MKVKQDKFSRLLEQADRQDPSTDFTELRRAFMETPFHEPKRTEIPGLQEMMAAYNKQDGPRVIQQGQALLALNPLSVDAHLMLRSAYHAAGDKTEADHHNFIGKGLAESILHSGTGTSPTSPFRIVEAQEAYALFRWALEGTPMAQKVLRWNGEILDEFLVSGDDLQVRKVYFGGLGLD